MGVTTISGTLFGLGLSQHIDNNGLPLSGCRLYIWLAETSTPAEVFADFGLSTSLSWPIVADANGRIPAFWLADGTYRARLTDKFGMTVFDEPFITAIGPSVGEGGGGGGGSVDPNSIFGTGDFLWKPVAGTKAGWVRSNGRTIGSGSSGATERANTDCLGLYQFFWNGFANDMCPVLGGRGASANADWEANKPIGTLDLRGKAPFGIQNMGSDSSGAFSGVTFTLGGANIPGAQGGTALHTLTTTQLAAHTHVMQTAGAHRHLMFNNQHLIGSEYQDITANKSPAFSVDFTPDNNPEYRIQQQITGNTDATLGRTSEVAAHLHVNESTGGGAAHPNMPPFALGTWFVKL